MLGANGMLMDAYDTDVRPLLATCARSGACPRDPIAAYKASGYAGADRGRAGRRPARPAGAPEPHLARVLSAPTWHRPEARQATTT